MIRFKVSKSDGHYTGFICEGHAGYAEEGQDIICSAVSALTINTVNSIDALTEDAFSVEQSEDGGYLKLTLTEIPSDRTVLLMDSLILGMKNILEAYGEDYLSVTIPQ
ncbi:MAG: ribosomal-processing cysteine protease Prp [Lachnospiraceae bacterium]|nr:ribosomal-processing cysteine protease Prp [Lachnospiraceae bacterium]